MKAISAKTRGKSSEKMEEEVEAEFAGKTVLVGVSKESRGHLLPSFFFSQRACNLVALAMRVKLFDQQTLLSSHTIMLWPSEVRTAKHYKSA